MHRFTRHYKGCAPTGRFGGTLRAFEARATTIAGALEKRYRIRDIALVYGGQPPVKPLMRSSAMSAMHAELAPMPVEAGDSEVVVTINGTIELLD